MYANMFSMVIKTRHLRIFVFSQCSTSSCPMGLPKYLTLDSVTKKTRQTPSSPFNPFGRRVEPVERAADWPPVLPPNPCSPIPDIRSIINNPTLFHLTVNINPGRGCFNAQLCQRVISLHYHRFALVITVVIIIITSCFNLK